MIGIFSQIKKNFKLKPQTYHIDNWIFQLHYRLTTLIFFVSTVLVTSRQYIGDHIKCISDSGVPNNVMNTFCFFTTTFTLIREHDNITTELRDGYEAHPGVGTYGFNSTEPIQRHAYYQWVPFVLFGQAIMFHFTHLLWKKLEGQRVRRLIEGLQYAAFSLSENDLQIKDYKIPSKEKKHNTICQIRKAFIERIYISTSWSLYLVLCEGLNVLNVILQFYITDEFLGKNFSNLGFKLVDEEYNNKASVLDEVFPKVTKCTFHKYGPSGSIQLHDAMCVMALNIINEKIYLILWFWFIILFLLTLGGFIWRILTIFLHSRSNKFNQLVFFNTCPGKLNPWKMLTVTKYCSFTDWLFLKYISKNLDGMVFRELMLDLAEDLEEKYPPLIDTLKKN